MIIGSLFLMLFIPLILLFAVGIPIIIGVCVYRDASRRVDCSPWLWALVAALVPSCIGLVIYLIVRRDYPLKESEFQSQQTWERREASFQNFDQDTAGRPREGLPTWAKALIIIGSVVILICIIALVGSALYSLFGYPHGAVLYHQGF